MLAKDFPNLQKDFVAYETFRRKWRYLFAYAGVKAAHSRKPGSGRDYSDRSGLPRGPKASRGLARQDFETPPDYRAEGTVAEMLPELVA